MNVSDTSFCRFGYPISFDPMTFRRRMKAVDASPGPGKAPLWLRETLPTDALLAHVADYLNSTDEPTALAWSLQKKCTLDSLDLLQSGSQWNLILSDGRQIPIRFDGVQLVLFRLGIALLVLGVRLDRSRLADGADSLGPWLDLLRFFRYTSGDSAPLVSSHPRTAAPPVALESLIEPLLQTVRLPEESGTSRWCRSIYVRRQLIPYYSLSIQGIINGGDEVAALGGWGGILFRLRGFFDGRQDMHPSEQDLSLDQPNMFEYAKDQYFITTMEGGGFIAADPPDTPFFQQMLSRHVGNHYYVLFLIAMNQRFTLMRLQHRVADEWIGERTVLRRERKFKQIYSELLDFHARAYFIQVMQRERHHRVYCRWQDAFHVRDLHREMSEQIHRMYAHLSSDRHARMVRLQKQEQTRSEGTKKLITNLTLGFGVPGLFWAFLGINIIGVTSTEGLAWRVAVLAFTIPSLIPITLALWASRNRKRRPRRQTALPAPQPFLQSDVHGHSPDGIGNESAEG